MRWEVSRVVTKEILRDDHFKDNQDISELEFRYHNICYKFLWRIFLQSNKIFVERFPFLPDCNSCDGKVLQANVVSQSLNALWTVTVPDLVESISSSHRMTSRDIQVEARWQFCKTIQPKQEIHQVRFRGDCMQSNIRRG